MFDLVFLELWPLNLRVTFTNNLRPIPVSFDVGSAALSTSVQNVVTTCSPRTREHVLTTVWTEVDSAVLPTSKDTGKRLTLFLKVTRKFNGSNSRKTRSNIPVPKCLTSFLSGIDSTPKCLQDDRKSLVYVWKCRHSRRSNLRHRSIYDTCRHGHLL